MQWCLINKTNVYFQYSNQGAKFSKMLFGPLVYENSIMTQTLVVVGQLNSVNLLLPSNLEAQKMLTLISRTSHTGFLIRFNGFFYDPGIELILKARPKLLLWSLIWFRQSTAQEPGFFFQFLVNICSILLVHW